ncbi:MAG TPA: M23 family metallopeptidase [Leifsonia sp.]|nr:M23 family metallopeptidase [Leifsonia sp.]
MNSPIQHEGATPRRGRPRRVLDVCLAVGLMAGLSLGAQSAAFAENCSGGDSGCAQQTPEPDPTRTLTPNPTPTPTVSPSPSPSPSSDPDRDGDSDAKHTFTSKPTPPSTPATPPTTPPPTATPTVTPTPITPTPTTPTPTPTPTSTPTPTPTASAPASPAPTDQIPLAADPVLSTGSTLDPAAAQQAAQLASDLAVAQEALTQATDTERGTQRDKDQAQSAADLLANEAKAAHKQAAASAAFATALLRVQGTRSLTSDPVATALSTPGNLLQKLGAVDRFNRATASLAAAMKEAAADAARARKLDGEAGAAGSTADGIDLAGSEAAVTAAQAQVDTATVALNSVPTLQAAGAGFRSLLSTPSTASGWALPVLGPLTDVFGPRPSRPAGTALFHPGDDLGANCGATIVAAAAGTVVQAGWNGGYGNFVLIDHGGGVQTAYGHIVDGGIAVTVGQNVAAGEPIAKVGTTGLSTGCHLHFEVRVGGVQIDPLPFMAARGVTLGVH